MPGPGLAKMLSGSNHANQSLASICSQITGVYCSLHRNLENVCRLDLPVSAAPPMSMHDDVPGTPYRQRCQASQTIKHYLVQVENAVLLCVICNLRRNTQRPFRSIHLDAISLLSNTPNEIPPKNV